MSNSRLFSLLLILGTAFWGVSFSLVKAGIGDGSPFVFLAYKFAVAAAVLCVLFAGRVRRLSRGALVAGGLIGLPLLLGNLFQTVGLQHTSVTNSAFITGLDVLMIPLFKWTLFRRPVQGCVWISGLLALSGLYLIVAQNGLQLNAGDVWTIACAVFFACYVLTVGYFAHRHDPLQTVIVALACCAFGCAVAGAVDPRAIWMPPDPAFWRGVLFAAVFATAFMHAVQGAAQRHLPEERVALTYLCEPVFAALAGVVLLGEALSLRTVAGAGMILVAMILAEIDLGGLLKAAGTGRARGVHPVGPAVSRTLSVREVSDRAA